MRLPSGVPGFDALIQGGFPSGTAVVIQGPAGKEKDTFLFQFIVEGLRKGGSALVVLSSLSPSKYLQELRDAGVDVERAVSENRLKFVDWFTYKEEAVQDVQQEGAVYRASIDLANVGIAISRAIAALPRDGDKRAAVEILSPALSVYDLPAVYGFAQSTKAKLERFGFTSLFVLEKEMHDERTLSSLHQPFDGVVDIERVREGDEILRKVAVLSLKGTAAESKYVPLEMGLDQVLKVSPLSERERTLRRQEELIKSNPKDPRLWIATARNLRAMGETDRALKCVEAALNLDPRDEETWRFKAELLEALGRKDEAAQARSRATPVVPAPRRDEASARLLGVVDARLRQNPRDPDALFVKAAALAKVEDLKGAVDALDALAKVDDAYPGLWVLKAKLHARRGEREKAQEARLRAQEIERRQQAREREAQARAAAPPRAATFECPECGAAVRENDTACPSCGVLFEGGEEAPRPPPRGVPPPKPKPEGARRGLTNGLARESPRGVGRTNGLVNGTRGRTNGLVNGTRGRTNGLVNGLRSLRAGMTNGLTNGSGFTNGLGSIRLRQEAKVRRWKLFSIPLAASLFLLLPLIDPSADRPGAPIAIDGAFSDWAGVPIPSGSASSGVPASADLVRAAVTDNGNHLAFYFEVAPSGTALAGGGTPPTADVFRAFVEVDGNASTGYRVAGLGADRLLEIAGFGGQIVSSRFLEWDGARDALDWNGWIKAAAVPAAAASGTAVEAQVQWGALAPVPGPVVAAFTATSYLGSTDLADFASSTAGGSLRIVENSIVPPTVTGANIPLARFDLSAAARPVSYEGFTVRLIGSAPPTAMSALRLVDGLGAELGSRVPVASTVSFQFPARSLAPGQTERLFVFGDAASSNGDTIGARFEGVSAPGSAVLVSRERSARDVGYLGAAPSAVVIDGGFAEWTVNATDPSPEPGVPDHVDLAGFAYYLNGQRASVYLRVAGRALAGSLVPAANPAVTGPGPGPGGADTDRDTVPDSEDPYPFDFNNDGTPDSATPSDRDQDGIADYPAGPDLFLNTTLPSGFPPPYADRPVSVYIGPSTLPRETGEDVARVFFDADNDTATGFRVDAIGADYLVELRGKGGEVTAQTLGAFAGATQWEWAWNVSAMPPAASDYSQIEFAFGVLGLGFLNDSRAYFDLRGWDGRDNSAGGPVVRMDTRGASAPTTRDISGNEKWFFRNTSTTGTGCTSNFAASTTAGSSATSTTLSGTQSICWFTPLGQPGGTGAGPWEVILDIDRTTDGTTSLVPNANGDTNAWVANSCAEETEYQCVDDDPNNGDTDYIWAPWPVITDSLFHVQDWGSPPSPLTVASVRVEASCRKTAPSAVDVRVIVKSGSTTSVGSTSTNCANSATYTVWSDTWTTDPADGSAWTLSDINALQVGVRDNDATTREVRVSHVKAIVSWYPVYSVQIDKCTNEACTTYTTLYGPTSGNTFGSDVTFTTGSIGAQALGASERFRFTVALVSGGTVTVRYNGANPGTDDSRATIPVPEFEEIAVPLGAIVTVVWIARRRRAAPGGRA